MKFFLWFLSIFSFLIVFVSCGSDGDDNAGESVDDSIGEPECLISQDCETGYECKDTKCVAIETPEEIIPDEPDEDLVENEPDIDTFEGCREHTECADDEICYESECVSPFEVNWLVSKISTCVSEDVEWDPSPECIAAYCHAPDLYVKVLLNDNFVFQTEEEADSYCADFVSNTLLSLTKNDKLSFDIVDHDLLGDDTAIEFYLDPPIPTWFFREGYIDIDCDDIDSVNSFKLSFQPISK